MEYRIWNEIEKKMENKIINDKYINPWTGLYDCNGTKLYVGDIVEMNDVLYKIVFERGAFSICTVNWNYTIDYEMFEAMKQIAFDDENLSWDGTKNDYIMPLWDLFDNFGYGENLLECLIIVGNIQENKELLNFTI